MTRRSRALWSRAMAAAVVAVPQRPSCSGGSPLTMASKNSSITPSLFGYVRGGRREHFAHAVVIVHEHAVGRGAQVGVVAAHDQEPEVRVVHRAARPRDAAAGEAAGRAAARFVGRRRERAQRAPLLSVGGRLLAAALGDPIVKLVGVEMVVAAIGQRRGDAVGKCSSAVIAPSVGRERSHTPVTAWTFSSGPPSMTRTMSS